MHSYFTQFQLLELKTRKKLSGKLLGSYASTFHGKGLEFQEFRAREEGQDSTDIDWFISSREGKILVRKMQEERDLPVLQILDVQILREHIFKKEKQKVLEEAFFLTSFSALQNGDRVATLLEGIEKTKYFPYSKKKSQLFQIYTELQESHLFPKHGNNHLSPIGVKNNLIFYYTDSFDIDRDRLKVLALKNQVVVVHIFHHFENTLETGSGRESILFGGMFGSSISLDIKDDKKRQEYVKLRTKKIDNFSKDLGAIGVDYILLDTKTDTLKKFIEWSNKK